jgi:RIO-like serine/threonine protein kinase
MAKKQNQEKVLIAFHRKSRATFNDCRFTRGATEQVKVPPPEAVALFCLP